MNARTLLHTLAVLFSVLTAAGCGRDAATITAPDAAAVQGLDGATEGRRERGADDDDDHDRRGLPDFDPEDFVSRVDNPWFPLTPGTVMRYEQETDEGLESTVFEVTHQNRIVMGVRTTVVHDRVYLDGELKEDTFDWFAQDEDGHVWYFGEDTKEYEGGVPVSTAGSWEAGVNGARPGVIMLARPRVGVEYAQERAPGVAEDRARVKSLSATARVPAGRFTGCLKTLDWNPLQSGSKEYKVYARGIGLVLETNLQGEDRVELVEVTR